MQLWIGTERDAWSLTATVLTNSTDEVTMAQCSAHWANLLSASVFPVISKCTLGIARCGKQIKYPLSASFCKLLRVFSVICDH